VSGFRLGCIGREPAVVGHLRPAMAVALLVGLVLPTMGTSLSNGAALGTLWTVGLESNSKHGLEHWSQLEYQVRIRTWPALHAFLLKMLVPVVKRGVGSVYVMMPQVLGAHELPMVSGMPFAGAWSSPLEFAQELEGDEASMCAAKVAGFFLCCWYVEALMYRLFWSSLATMFISKLGGFAEWELQLVSNVLLALLRRHFVLTSGCQQLRLAMSLALCCPYLCCVCLQMVPAS